MSDDELRAIGLFKTLRGKDEKFFPNDETFALRYQEQSKPSAATAKKKAKHTRENLTALTTSDLRKIYREVVPHRERNDEKHARAEYATKEFMIDAILKA